MRIFFVALAAFLGFISFSFTDPSFSRASDFKIVSNSFVNEGKIPLDFVSDDCGGTNNQPHLSWSGAPADTGYFAIIMDDPDAQSIAGYTWVHLNIYNIPANISSIPEGKKINDGRYRKNHNKKKAYTGPCAPKGTHKYIFSIYALSKEIPSKYFGNFGAGSKPHNHEKFENLFGDIIIGKSEYVGFWR